MTEPADQPLLESPAEDAPKKAKRRTTTTARATRSKAKKTAVAQEVPAAEAAPAKSVAPAPEPELQLTGEPEAKEGKSKAAKTRAPRKKATVSRKKTGATGEDGTSTVAEEPAPRQEKSEEPTPAAAAAPVAQPVPSQAPAPVAPEAPAQGGGGRRYPVYIPRNVARQLEAEGKQVGVSISSADELPQELLQQIAAATSSQPQSRRESREQREPREPREPREHQQRHRQQEPPSGVSGGGMESLPPELIAGGQTPLEGEPKPEELAEGEGLIEISGKGFGFLRDPKRNFAQAPNDIFVTPEIVKSFHLRDGQWLKGIVRRGPRGAQLHKLLEVNGDPAESVKNLPAFDELTVVSPEPRITLETVPDRFTTRILDLMCPIGRGQRALVVAPPRTGKTTFLLHIADAVKKNHPDIHLMFLLVDERPEEVTDIRRSVPGAEVFASSNDLDVKSHTRIAQLAIERAKRLVEQNKHVFILLDSITRVGRAFNNAMTGGGRTGSGGLDSRALEIPRRLFAAARNTEEAGSLTIVGTTLVETNSRADEVIFQEFKGTGNMELVLDRRIAEQRVYPAIDIFMSGTRREELLIPEADLHKIHIIRRGLAGYKPLEAVERLLFFMKKFPTNAQMLAGIPG
jgi:transcription termination factor Rho